MPYPADVFFDIDTLVNVAQPRSILVLGDCEPTFLNDYVEQKSVINHICTVTHIASAKIDALASISAHFDVAIAIELFEHIDKQTGMQVLSRLRDVLSAQYCICLPLNKPACGDSWQLTDLFSFALTRVANYDFNKSELGLFKYNINDYKSTPDWLNADNWANPNMWGKYRW